MPLKNSLLILITILISYNLYGQDQMERLYRSDRQNTALDVVQTSDDGYLMLSAGRDLDSTDYDFYNITKLSDKGDVSWSMDYKFEEKVNPAGSLMLLEADSFLVYGTLLNMPKDRFLMKGDPGGNVVSTMGYERTNVTNNIFTFETPLNTSYRDGYVLGGVDVDPFSQTNLSWMTELGTNGEILWSNNYTNPDYDLLTFTKVQSMPDSGLVAFGSIAETFLTSDLCIIKTDSVGQIEWSRKYGDTLISEVGTAIISTPDNGYLLGGSSVNGTLGLLIKTDTLGQVQWAANIDFGIANTTLFIHQMIMASDGNAVIAGTLFGPSDNFAFMLKVDMVGTVVWKRKYRESTDDFQGDGLIQSTVDGYVFLTTSEENGDQVGPHLIKTNVDGEAMTCDTAIMEDLLVPITISVDTLSNIATIETVNSSDVLVEDTLPYGGFNPPTLSLPIFEHCPDDVFSDTIDATTPGAIAYEWSTDETTPSIVVTEFGDYMVTVTMGEDYCYILCGSSSVNEKPLPMVSIGVDQSPYCTQGFVSLAANASETDSLAWSTGEGTPVIQVDQNGPYTVAAFNECGVALDDIDLSINTSPPTVEIIPQGDYCTEGEETLFANVSAPINSLLWSNGTSEDSIVASQPGSYSVTIMTDFCGENSDSYEIVATPPTVAIFGDGSYCEDGEETLTALTTGPVSGILWSTGATTDTIVVTTQGVYTVTTTTPFCGESSSSADIVCPIDVQVPNVFTPDGDELNDGFQPYFSVPASEFVTYRFCVYSRWGEKVFETTDPLAFWDGTFKDELAVSDVYIWTLEGTTSLGEEIPEEDRSGDVSLMR